MNFVYVVEYIEHDGTLSRLATRETAEEVLDTVGALLEAPEGVKQIIIRPKTAPYV